ncbi:FecR domain-containing protein [bacterium]
MKNRKLLISIFLYLLFTNLLFAKNIEITSLSGIVDARLSGETGWKPVDKGEILHTKDILRTGPASKCRLLLPNGTKINVGSNSEVEISELGESKNSLTLFIGKLKAIVKKLKPKEKFNVRTPVTVCSVRGTAFTIEVFEDKTTLVHVHSGIVATRRLAKIGEEILVHPNERIRYQWGQPPVKEKETIIKAMLSSQNIRAEIKQEMSIDMNREQIQTAAAKEMQFAEYQLGKTMIDAFGKRVRLEEYIIRPADDKFKFVILNDRDQRFDWFTYESQFNQNLPTDLASIKNSFFDPIIITTIDNDNYYSLNYVKTRSNLTDYIIEKAFLNYSGGINSYDTSKYEFIINGTDITNFSLTRDPPIVNTYKSDTNENGIDFEYVTRTWTDNEGKEHSYKEDFYLIDDNGKNSTNPNEYNGEMVYTSDLMEDKIDLIMDPKLFE